MPTGSKKRWIGVALTIVAACALTGQGFAFQMGEPLYRPGMVREGVSLRGSLDPPAQTSDSGTWRVEQDINLHHFQVGSGPAVLFVHGGPGFPAHEPPAGLAPLAKEFTLHFYDQRGCGRSTRPIDRFPSSNFHENMMELDRTLGLAAQIADIERIRRILQADRLILVGHSFGGLLASLYASEFPERVRAMVLIAPADLLVFPAPRDLFAIMRDRLPVEEREGFDRFLGEYMNFGGLFSQSESEIAALQLRFGGYYLIASGLEREFKNPTPKERSNGGWMTRAMFMSMGLRHDYRPALRAVRAPVLVIHPEKDLQPIAGSQSYVDDIANARLEVAADAGHFVLDEEGAGVTEIIGGFLKSVESNR